MATKKQVRRAECCASKLKLSWGRLRSLLNHTSLILARDPRFRRTAFDDGASPAAVSPRTTLKSMSRCTWGPRGTIRKRPGENPSPCRWARPIPISRLWFGPSQSFPTTKQQNCGQEQLKRRTRARNFFWEKSKKRSETRFGPLLMSSGRLVLFSGESEHFFFGRKCGSENKKKI